MFFIKKNSMAVLAIASAELIGRLIGIERTGSEATIKKQQLRLTYDAKNRVDYLTTDQHSGQVATKTSMCTAMV